MVKVLKSVSVSADNPREANKELVQTVTPEIATEVKPVNNDIKSVEVSEEESEENFKKKKEDRQNLENQQSEAFGSTDNELKTKQKEYVIPHGLLICLGVLFAPLGGPFSFILVPAQASSLLLIPYAKKIKRTQMYFVPKKITASDTLVTSKANNPLDRLVTEGSQNAKDALAAGAPENKDIVFVKLTPEQLNEFVENISILDPENKKLKEDLVEFLSDESVAKKVKEIAEKYNSDVSFSNDISDEERLDAVNSALYGIADIARIKGNDDVLKLLNDQIENINALLGVTRDQSQVAQNPLSAAANTSGTVVDPTKIEGLASATKQTTSLVL